MCLILALQYQFSLCISWKCLKRIILSSASMIVLSLLLIITLYYFIFVLLHDTKYFLCHMLTKFSSLLFRDLRIFHVKFMRLLLLLLLLDHHHHHLYLRYLNPDVALERNQWTYRHHVRIFGLIWRGQGNIFSANSKALYLC